MLQRWRARWDGMLASRRFSQQRARLAVDGGCTIVAYHGVAPRSSGRLNTKTISSALFEQHLRLLCQYATPIRLREAEIGTHASGRLRVALTFDDGLASVARYALPLLERYDVPATLFVTAAWTDRRDVLWPDLVDLCRRSAPPSITVDGRTFHRNHRGQFQGVDGAGSLRDAARNGSRAFLADLYRVLAPHQAFRHDETLAAYWRLLDEDALRHLAAHPLIEIGAHGVSHRFLPALPVADSRRELAAARESLEAVIGREVDALAHPFGFATAETCQLAVEAGYRRQYLCAGLDTAPAWEGVQDRVGVNPFVSAEAELFRWYTARR